MPQLDFSFFPSQILWLIVAFSFLCAAMYFVIVPKIERILSARQSAIVGDAQGVHDILIEIDELNALKHKKSLDTKKQVDSMHNNMTSQFAEMKSKRFAELDEKFKNLRCAQDKEIAEYVSRMSAMRTEAVAVVATVILERVTGREVDQALLQRCCEAKNGR